MVNRSHQSNFIDSTFIYLDHPLPVQYIKILKTTNTTLTVQWNDDQQNRNANVTTYELTLK